MNVSPLYLAKQKSLRSIDWYEQTCRSISAVFPELRTADSYIVAQFSSLLLERLDPVLAKRLLELLPEGAAPEYFGSLLTHAFSDANLSIGYPDFVQKANYVLGVLPQLKTTDKATEPSELKAQKLADHFLWVVAEEFPPELKLRISEELPLELRSRMNLYSAHSDDSKVG